MKMILPAKFVPVLLAAILVINGRLGRAVEPARRVGVVSHVKVLSDKVADVSSLEAWKKSFIKDGREKKDVHVARSPRETYKITCTSKPTMKSISLELAE